MSFNKSNTVLFICSECSGSVRVAGVAFGDGALAARLLTATTGHPNRGHSGQGTCADICA